MQGALSKVRPPAGVGRLQGTGRPQLQLFASTPRIPALQPPNPPQFFRLGSLKPHDPNEAYQPDTRLRLGLGLKAAGVGGKTYSAGALRALAGPCNLAAWRRCAFRPLRLIWTPLSLADGTCGAPTYLQLPAPFRTLPAADDVLLSLSAKKKVAVQRSQEVVRGRLLLRNYTQARRSIHKLVFTS